MTNVYNLNSYDKFDIGYREEDHHLYLEYDDIIKMYNTEINF